MKNQLLDSYFKKQCINTTNYTYVYETPNLEITVYDNDVYVNTYSIFSKTESDAWTEQVYNQHIEEYKSVVPEELLPYVDFETFATDILPSVNIWEGYGKIVASYEHKKDEVYTIIEVEVFKVETPENVEIDDEDSEDDE